MNEQIEMYLNIAGTQVPVKVPFDDQNRVRDVEKQVNELYSTWRRKFKKKSDREILAMVAYQYARYYSDLMERYETASRLTEECHAAAAALESAAYGVPTDAVTPGNNAPAVPDMPDVDLRPDI